MLKLENNSNKKILFLISILIIILNTFKCSSDDTNIGKILIKDGIYLAKEYNILSTNKNNPRIDNKCKICVIASREDYENLCRPFIKIYYDKWVFEL